MRLNRIFGVLLLVGLAVGQSWPAAAADELLLARDKREPSPKLALKDIEGQKHQLIDLKGKIVVLNFWATWCVPCKVEMPEFARVQQQYKDRGVEFIGAANERFSDKDKVMDFARKVEVQFPIWLDANLYHLAAFKVGPGVPGTVVIDQSGRIAARIKGETDGATLRSIIDRLLAEATTTTAAPGGR